MGCVNPIFIRKTKLLVPCGRCGNCVRRLISDYTLRCQVEHKWSKRSYFVTLTYEKDPLQLYKTDLQRYFKRMRKVGFKFSYFALGDYGDTFGRPHFHVIFFVKGFFPAEYLHSLWISGDQTRRRGFIDCKPLSFGRIAYVVKYGYLAKLDWDKSNPRVKPFFLMSKRPALGSQYLTKAKKFWHKRADKWYFPDGPYKKPLPRYFKEKIFSKLERLKNSVKFESMQADLLEVELDKLSESHSNPIAYYYERMNCNADAYLSKLRVQKSLKSKLL